MFDGLICETCKKPFTVKHVYYAKKGRGRFCSRLCSSKRAKKWDTVLAMKLWESGESARQVGIKVGASVMTISKWLKSNGIYETRHARRDRCHMWNGGVKVYRKIAFEYWGEKCFKCGYSKYPNILHGHHINRDRTDNSKDNLRPLCPTCHEEIHFEEKTGRYNPAKNDRMKKIAK